MSQRKFNNQKTAFEAVCLVSIGPTWAGKISLTSTTSLKGIIPQTKNPAKLQDFEDSTERGIYRVATYINSIANIQNFVKPWTQRELNPRNPGGDPDSPPGGPRAVSVYH